MATTKLLYAALATLALGTAITPATAFEVERGPRGGYRIVTERQETAEAKVKTQKTQARRTPIIIRGSHGAQKIVNQENVGGPVQSEYKGFPQLEQRGSHGAFHIVND